LRFRISHPLLNPPPPKGRGRILGGSPPQTPPPSPWEGEDIGGGGIWNLEFRLEFGIWDLNNLAFSFTL